MAGYLFSFIFNAYDAQILKSMSVANMPKHFQKSGWSEGSKHAWVKMNAAVGTGVYPLINQSLWAYKRKPLNEVKGLPTQLRNNSTTVFFVAFSSSASHRTWHYCSLGKLGMDSIHQQKENRIRNKNVGHQVTVNKMKPNRLICQFSICFKKQDHRCSRYF